MSSQTYEAAAYAVCEGFNEVRKSVADVHVVYNAGPQGFDGAAKQGERNGDVFFCCAERKGFEQDDGHADYAKERAYRSVSEIVPWVKAFDDHFKHITRGVNDFVYVMAVVGVPLC